MTPGCGCPAHMDEQNSCATPIPQAPTREPSGRSRLDRRATETFGSALSRPVFGV